MREGKHMRRKAEKEKEGRQGRKEGSLCHLSLLLPPSLLCLSIVTNSFSCNSGSCDVSFCV